MSKPGKLHWISYLSRLFKTIKSNLFPFILLMVLNPQSLRPEDWTDFIIPIVYSIVVLVSFIYNGFKVYKTRYWIEDSYFILTEGVLNKSRTELNIKRIQSMDTTQDLVHQIVGGVRLSIKTPSDGITLDTVTKSQSQAIQKAIQSQKDSLTGEAPSTEISSEEPRNEVKQTEVYHLSQKDLIYMSLTSGAIGVALAALSPILGTLFNALPDDMVDKVFEQFGVLAHILPIIPLLMIVAVIIIASYVLGSMITFVRYFRFRLRRDDTHLFVKYGLFKVRQVTVPLERLQAVKVERSFIRSLMGYTSLSFVITSDMDINDVNQDMSKVPILPFIKKKDMEVIRQSLVPNYQFKAANRGMPGKALPRRIVIPLLLVIVVCAVLHYFVSPWFWLLTLVLGIWIIFHAFISNKHSGSAIEDDEITIQDVKAFSVETTYIKRDKILEMNQIQHPFLKRAGLINYQFLIADGMGLSTAGLRFEDADKVKHYEAWYLKRGEHNV
ncbi:PH domain-containing protein [Staphylococcus massiliensis]|uniref:Membrane-flanked domain-containing protein n=1 Tax=Staphylococcus massiliensis S46 TaxID=1229783 RepID=K9AIK8_9STAP|nr:PH domain-containing protein [Staphylococcus massiliensis]EKU47134.1 membrane-flanked domain-containing protein [Staphylococcus massiliensis S46]MCG3400141.1 PH domain-containing protein [Staphylococcus massiliensis]MCG3402708.1 PH domain-containing protein [Staphylococcus massiliensis]MCG3413369.1 PH domain-containing protein [Staphylococcus massiliensis]PNZ98308.1 hypothetical protein CD133_08935 [Staphylococcus massiliensis CCUG 55927]